MYYYSGFHSIIIIQPLWLTEKESKTIIIRHVRYKKYAMEVVSLSQKLINVIDVETPPVKTYVIR